METVSLFLAFASLILLVVGVVFLIIRAVTHKKKKPAVLMIVLAVVLFVVSFLIMPFDATATQNPESSGSSYSDTEIFASEFCMAYMNNLKNPYSFHVKSIWAMDNGDDSYQVYVKFTAENGLGAEVADTIATMGSLTSENLKDLASGGDYVNIYTWNSEPSGKIVGDGETLSAERIQTYINEHYE